MKAQNQRATIKDIARELGLSISTVSRILRGCDLFNEETIRRVHEKAQEMRYRPNIMARALVRKGSSLIGLVLRDIGQSFFPDIITGVQLVLEEHGYNTVLCNSSMNPSLERMHLKRMLDTSVEGIVITPISNEKVNVDAYQEVMGMGIPLAMIGNPRVGVRAPYVKVDDVLGGATAAKYLIGLGHRCFAYFSCSKRELTHRSRVLRTENMDRHDGFLQVVRRYELEKSFFVVDVPNSTVGDDVIDAFLALRPRPSAIFAYSDLIAIHTIRLLERRGFRVPQDISVVGYDDVEPAALTNPALTTLAQPKREMGMIAAQKVLNLIQGKKVSDTVLVPELVVRASSGTYRLAQSPPPASQRNAAKTR